MSGPRRRRHRAPRGAGELLRAEILDAATDLLLETGDEKEVSIRSVAHRVGVTPPSIYLHFADKTALLDAVCGHYFEKLDEEMQAVASAYTSAIDVLRAQGMAYLRFALKTPVLYRIAMLGHGSPGSDVDVALNSSAFGHLRATVQALIADGTYPSGDPTLLALELWTAMHGIAAMLISRPYLPWGDAEQFADRLMRAVCCGQMVAGALRPGDSPQQVMTWLKEVVDEQQRG
ncbi:TetR/AcrR family transcriptional regulator [Mycobacterium sp. smrl_JER01]|uniref:TetR/AcrR family transcriptional regulator n=1 Tax=Mycobacterium sp. smrl_JER01 TaxID=3402633 RepID=UPI003ACF8F6A